MLKYILAVIMLYSCTAWAAEEVQYIYPDYFNDEGYDHCVKITNDYDNCLKEEGQRVLRDVKILYKNILADPQMTSWNGSLEANRDVLRDMYESWSAYRNRLCSLHKVTSKYIGPVFEPEISCVRYMNYVQKDYLSNLLHTLNLKKQNNPYEKKLQNGDGGFPYLEFIHDDEYSNCIKDTDKTECTKKEADKYMLFIKKDLAGFIELPATKKWNNGPDLKNGNYRDMFDSWIAYRNRICSLTAYIQKTKSNSNYDLNECISFHNIVFEHLLNGYLTDANSYLDEEMLPASDAEEEGGEAEGKKIKPLERKFSPNINDSLSTGSLVDEGTTENPVEETAEEPKNTDDRNRKIPSWAKQK